MLNRKRITVDAETDWKVESVIMPKKMVMKRIRAIVESPGTQLALSIREAEPIANALDIPLEYELSNSPLDSEESILVVLKALPRDSANGLLHVAYKADSNCSMVIQLEYEVD